MTYDDLLELGRKMAPEVREENLRALARDSRFAALLFHVEQQKDEFVRAFANPEIANFPGCLQHSAGSIHTHLVIQEYLRGLCDAPPPERRRQAAEGEEE